MADAADSKSAEGNFMRVRLPPSAPREKLWLTFRHKKRAPIKKQPFEAVFFATKFEIQKLTFSKSHR